MIIPERAAAPTDANAPLPVLRSALLATIPQVVHGFTGRIAGMGRADGNVSYSAPRDRDDAWQMRQRWAEAIGVDPAMIVAAGQVHGTTVAHVAATAAGQGARPDSDKFGIADALITNQPRPVLFSLHADCLPLLLVDPGSGTRGPAIAAVHAGWRGTVQDVVGHAVAAMVRAFGSRPAELVAYIGPTIGTCCYEVGDDVQDAWQAAAPHGGAALIARSQGVSFDLVRANVHLLAQAGVSADRIERSGICTRCAGDAWFSHRGQGSFTGRFAAMIALQD